MKRFYICDIHGGIEALVQVLHRSGFDYDNDKLIVGGDTADGWPDASQCFEELLKIKNLVYILGNHDDWLLNWFNTREEPLIWTSQGGKATIKSYESSKYLIEPHKLLLEEAPWFYEEDNKLFLHGGYDLKDKRECMWDRSLWNNRNNLPAWTQQFDEIYVGHTSIWHKHNQPTWYNNVCFCDTGGGYEGKLSMINIDTHEVFQSDMVNTLYPDFKHGK